MIINRGRSTPALPMINRAHDLQRNDADRGRMVASDSMASRFSLPSRRRIAIVPLAIFLSGARHAAAAAAPPTEEDRDRDIRIVESRVTAKDVSPTAVAAAARAIGTILETAMPEVARGLAQGNVFLFIIPKDKKLTDVPEFSGLRGKTTFDGRLWDDVRGVGYYPLADGRGVGVAVGEENLLGGTNDPPEGYPALFVLAHEFSHSVQFVGLPTELYDRSLKIYRESMLRKEGTGLGRYADANANEDFAQAAAAYFGVGHLDSPKQHGEAARRRLREGQPRMYELVAQIYGPVRNLDAAGSAARAGRLDRELSATLSEIGARGPPLLDFEGSFRK